MNCAVPAHCRAAHAPHRARKAPSTRESRFYESPSPREHGIKQPPHPPALYCSGGVGQLLSSFPPFLLAAIPFSLPLAKHSVGIPYAPEYGTVKVLFDITRMGTTKRAFSYLPCLPCAIQRWYGMVAVRCDCGSPAFEHARTTAAGGCIVYADAHAPSRSSLAHWTQR